MDALLHRRRALPIIIFTLILDYIGVGILLPIGAILFTDRLSPQYLLPASYSMQTGYILFGLLIAIYPLMQFLAAPILGQLSDHYGRKPVLIAALLGTLLSYVLFGLGIVTRNIPLLFLARGLDGVTGANVTVAQAVLADVTEPKHRAKVFSLVGASLGVGITLGPLLGGVLSNSSVVHWFTFATPFWFAAGLTAINIGSVALFLGETKAKVSQAVGLRMSQSFLNIRKAFGLSSMRVLFITSFLFGSGFAFYTSFIPVFLVQRFGFNQTQLGTFFFLTGLMVIVTQALVPQIVAHWFTEPLVLRISLLGAAVFPLGYVLTHVWWYLLFLFPFFSSFIALSMANIIALISKSATSERQGEVLGLNTSVLGLGQAIPPLFGGFVAALLVFWAPLIISALTLGLAGIIFMIWYRPNSLPD
jgi:DHA1 family tetracycline resistance protein-like MFS transporter